MERNKLGGGFKYFLNFTPKIGEDEPNLTSIFFRWVGSTTNQIWSNGGSFWVVATQIFFIYAAGWCGIGEEIFFHVHPDPWGNDPIWRPHIFQVGWFNHQLEYCWWQPEIPRPTTWDGAKIL